MIIIPVLVLQKIIGMEQQFLQHSTLNQRHGIKCCSIQLADAGIIVLQPLPKEWTTM